MLRASIRLEFGSNRQFARALGVTEGRVSQLLSPKTNLTPSSLQEILRVFSQVALQSSLFDAWSRDIANPTPTVPRGDADTAVEHLLVQYPSLVSSGHARWARHQFSAALPQVIDTGLRFRIQATLADLYLFLGEPSEAFRSAKHLFTHAQCLGETLWALEGQWRIALALRNAERCTTAERVAASNRFSELLRTWKPSSAEAKERRRHLRLALERDYVLTALSATRGSIPRDDLSRLLQSLQQARTLAPEPEHQPTIKLVETRLLLRAGMVTAAEDAGAEMQGGGDQSPEHGLKLTLVEAQLVAARGESEEAEHLMEQARDRAFSLQAFQQVANIERERQRLIFASLSPSRGESNDARRW